MIRHRHAKIKGRSGKKPRAAQHGIDYNYWFLALGLEAMALAGLYYEAGSRCVRGWLAGEAFYAGRPTSYWGEELEDWRFISLENDQGGAFYKVVHRSSFDFIRRHLPTGEVQTRRLLKGDPDALAVLQQLRCHPSPQVRVLSRMAIDQSAGP